MNKPHDIYTANDFRAPDTMFGTAKLTKPVNDPIHCAGIGLVALASERAKSGPLLSWSSVMRAIRWAAERSPAIRADLRVILAETDTAADSADTGGDRG